MPDIGPLFNPYMPVRMPTTRAYIKFLENVRKDKERAALLRGNVRIPERDPGEVIAELASEFEASGWRDHGGEG